MIDKSKKELAQRKDLTAFLDSLFAAAIAFGLTLFYRNISEAVSKRDISFDLILFVVLASVALITAIGFIVDDWRSARWLIRDYGYRLDKAKNLNRYWVDCILVLVAFFMVASAFKSPLLYMVMIALHLLIGFLWMSQLKNEIKESVKNNGGEYPENSIELTTEIAEKKDFGKGLHETDYRINRALNTHLVGGSLYLVLFITIIVLRFDNLKIKSLWQPSPEVLPSIEIQSVSTFFALTGLIVMVKASSRVKERWLIHEKNLQKNERKEVCDDIEIS